MSDAHRSFRQVPIGATVPQAVTVGIESDGAAGHKAAVWWAAVGEVDADEAAFIEVAAALDAAEAARVLHGFTEVVVVLQDGVRWQVGWGELRPISGAGLSEQESYQLAAGLEAETDA